MEKTKLLTVAVIGLLLINLGTLGFLFLSNQNGHRPPHEGGRPEPKYEIIERLHFDTAQQKEYDQLIEWHRNEIEKLDSNIRKAKNELYSKLAETDVDAKMKDSLIALINSNQKQIEITHFKHFEDIKKLCRKDQIKDFNLLSEELARLFASRPHRPMHD